jgi:hypothetical protein
MCNEFTQEQTLANHYALKQANELFEQQIKDAYIEGYSSNLNAGDSEKYYNETYKKI